MKRLADQVIVDPKAELLGNLYPLVRLALINQAKVEKDLLERLNLCEEAVAEIITNSEDRIHDRLAGRIQATVDIGMEICKEVASRATPESPLDPKLILLIGAYRDSSGVLLQMVEDVLVTEEDEDDEEADDGSDGDDRDSRRPGSGGDERQADDGQEATEEK